MEKEKKNRKFLKCAGWTVLAYLVLSVLAGIASVVRIGTQGESGTVSFWMLVELVVFPVLFLLAGYVLTAKCGFGKFKTHKVWLFSALFSLVLLLLWYVLLDVYVLLNLPVAEGVAALDAGLRKITVVQEYVVLFLSQTDGYRYVILPMIHFVVRIIYWLFYMWGNRMYVTKQETRKKSKR